MTVDSPESARVTNARSRAEQRVRRQRGMLRPLGLVIIAVVVVTTINEHPAPGVRGDALGITLAICVFAGALAIAIRPRFVERPQSVQAALIGAMGGAAVVLAALEPSGSSALAGGVAVWMAFARLPLRVALPLGGGTTTAVTVAALAAGSSAAGALAGTLLCALLGFVAYFLREARASQDRTELLLAELEDARERQLEAAAVSERGRIASELHDVLAHSLSGAAIQLQGARKLADRESASVELRTALERAGELVRDGLADAREAVGALRGERLPNVGQLDALVTQFRADTGIDVTLAIDGRARALPADASLALYRGAQEALTNVVRHAPGAVANVVLSYRNGRTNLSVENDASAAPAGLEEVGGGRGLSGLRERVERLGGTVRAGPTESGWRVELEVPA